MQLILREGNCDEEIKLVQHESLKTNDMKNEMDSEHAHLMKGLLVITLLSVLCVCVHFLSRNFVTNFMHRGTPKSRTL
jgi:hypothetical protein